MRALARLLIVLLAVRPAGAQPSLLLARLPSLMDSAGIPGMSMAFIENE